MAGEPREGDMRDFVERVCTGYSGFMSTHVRSFWNRLNTVLADA